MLEKTLIQKIKAEFPRIEWKEYKFLSHGWDHFAIILDNKIVFRSPKKASDNLKNELYNEAGLLRYLKQKVAVGIPEYIYISKDKSLAGYKMLSGTELEPSFFESLSDAAKEKIAKQLANFISTLHATPKYVIKEFNVEESKPQKDYTALTDNSKKLLFPKLDKKEVQMIKKFLKELKTTLDHKYSNVLIHTDLKWEHLLWNTEKNKLNIIDFSDREFGDPATDFTSLWAFGNKFTNRVYELYEGKKDEKFLYRSQLYFKKIPLLVMQGVIEGYPLSFEEAHKMFRQRFET
ncbi:aminoglycoside phosphotransferase family protein [Candidatus Parcubacteria bacterium]|jgi:aminoglycoside phosphotransferase (APT) family kinase protein|nr:aminoglycoside phosphotransferase family protein [Candidatus Parcubacteria bacterium]